MRKRKLLWLIPLLLGLLPYIWALIGGVYAAVTGFSGVAVLGPRYYGLTAFLDWVLLFSYVAWPLYLAGTVLAGISTYMLLKKSADHQQ